MKTETAALGIHQVLNAQRAEGIRMVSIKQGFAPRDFTLVAPGGAGPLHAVALAEELGMDTVLVPRYPGVLSAAGLLGAAVEHAVATGYPMALAKVSPDEVKRQLAGLDAKSAALMAGEAVAAGGIAISYSADVCYVGQSYYLKVPLHLDEPAPLARLYEHFMDTHERVFGYATQSPARLVNLRSVHRASIAERAAAAAAAATQTSDASPAPRSRLAMLSDAAPPRQVPVYAREALAPGNRIAGPAIIEQRDTTTLNRHRLG